MLISGSRYDDGDNSDKHSERNENRPSQDFSRFGSSGSGTAIILLLFHDERRHLFYSTRLSGPNNHPPMHMYVGFPPRATLERLDCNLCVGPALNDGGTVNSRIQVPHNTTPILLEGGSVYTLESTAEF